MTSCQMKLAFGSADAVHINSERAFIDSQQKSKRPIADAKFRAGADVWSTTSHRQIGKLSVVATTGTPIQIVTRQEPQYTIVVPISGSGQYFEEGSVVTVGEPKLIRTSYHNPVKIDYGQYSVCVISPDIDQLLDAMRVESRDRGLIKERLFEVATEQIPDITPKLDYYAAFRSILRILDASSGELLERIGIDKLLTKLIAELTLSLDPTLLKFVATPPPAQKARAL